MSLLTVPEVRALVTTPLSDADLQDVIDREEAWLARRVGQLSGPRTVTIPEPSRYAPVVLLRPTAEVTVTDAGTDVDATLVGTQHVHRDDRLAWIGPVTVTYTPDDEDEVRRVVIELVRLTLSASPFESETIGDYSYTRGQGGGGPSRHALARSLTPLRGAPTSIRLEGAWR